jgi:hypothetical protein
MDQLSPQHVPVYETRDQRRNLWEQCAERGQPVIAIRDGRRGYIVHYDVQHLDAELRPVAVQNLRQRTRDWRPYPTGTDPISESEAVGGEAGPISGHLHADSEASARELASRLSSVVFDRENWQRDQPA